MHERRATRGSNGRSDVFVRAARACLALLVWIAAAGCGGDPPSGPRPNVVLYLIDTLRADRLGAYGYARPTSPTLDALAEAGVVFERAYAPDSRTLGSVASILTGVHTPDHGVGQYGKKIPDTIPTLASLLADAGYDTASFVTNISAGEFSGADRGFAHFHDAIRNFRDREARRSLPEEAFVAWLDRPRDAPFFAYVHTAEPHRPYVPPPEALALFDTGYQGPIDGFFEGPHGYAKAESPEEIRHVGALYDGEVRVADEAVGRLLEILDERGLRKDTVVIVIADHGEELHERGGWNHGHTAYDELLRVPLLMQGPGVAAGLRVPTPVALVDLAPTLLELAGAEKPAHLAGRSLWSLASGQADPEGASREVFAMTTQSPKKAVLVAGNWKLIATERGGLELYDLASDPGEQRDLSKQETEIRRALLRLLRPYVLASPESRKAAGPPAEPLDEEATERLRALGYIE